MRVRVRSVGQKAIAGRAVWGIFEFHVSALPWCDFGDLCRVTYSNAGDAAVKASPRLGLVTFF